MRIHSLSGICVVEAALLLSTGTARAAEEAPADTPAAAATEPTAAATEPAAAAKEAAPFTPFLALQQVLPPGFALPYLTFSVARTGPETDPGVGLSAGVTIGLFDRFQFDANVVAVTFTPDVGYGNIRFAPVYMLVGSQPLEIDALVRTTIKTDDFAAVNSTFGADVIIEPGIPAYIRFGERIRLDVAAYVPFYIGKETNVGLNFPVNVGVQISPNIHAGVNSGLNVLDFGHFGDTSFIPLGFSAGYSFAPTDTTYFSAIPFFVWPAFVQPGNSAQTTNTEFFVVGVSSLFAFKAY